MANEKVLGLGSGVGLVVANMVGAGVFLSTGFMSQSMPPSHILLAWVVGAGLALFGARAYAEVARIVPEGGGEYRYLSTLIHPSLGFLAGWASLLVGFSAPIALDAMAAGAFAHSVWDEVEPRTFGAGLILLLSGMHAVGLHLSARVQNVLVGLKIVLLIGFVGVGLMYGTLSWPTWAPPNPASNAADAFMGSLFYIAFAFSGWNAAIYAASEFKNPLKDVPRAMLLGCLGVGVLYLVVNFIFVANLTPADASVVFNYGTFSELKGDFDSVTLGQAVVGRLISARAAELMGVVMLIIFTSALSAMLLLGPRVYSAMASDGVLPTWLRAKEGKPPIYAVLLQGLLACLIMFTHGLREILSSVGAILVLFAALTVAGLFFPKAKNLQISPIARVCAALYIVSAGWMLWVGVNQNPKLYVWVLGCACAGLIAWFIVRSMQPAVKAP